MNRSYVSIHLGMLVDVGLLLGFNASVIGFAWVVDTFSNPRRMKAVLIHLHPRAEQLEW